jgi:pectin methylesterase-like acyl-CoA thioesterase
MQGTGGRNRGFKAVQGFCLFYSGGFCASACLIGMLISVGSVSAATYNVPGDYSTIQAAINAANPGDTINVSAGTYTENVDVNESVNLVGAGAGDASAATLVVNRPLCGRESP